MLCAHLYLLFCVLLLYQNTSSNGFTLPFTSISSKVIPRRPSNSSVTPVKNLPAVSTNNVNHCNSFSSFSGNKQPLSEKSTPSINQLPDLPVIPTASSRKFAFPNQICPKTQMLDAGLSLEYLATLTESDKLLPHLIYPVASNFKSPAITNPVFPNIIPPADAGLLPVNTKMATESAKLSPHITSSQASNFGSLGISNPVCSNTMPSVDVRLAPGYSSTVTDSVNLSQQTISTAALNLGSSTCTNPINPNTITTSGLPPTSIATPVKNTAILSPQAISPVNLSYGSSSFTNTTPLHPNLASSTALNDIAKLSPQIISPSKYGLPAFQNPVCSNTVSSFNVGLSPSDSATLTDSAKLSSQILSPVPENCASLITLFPGGLSSKNANSATSDSLNTIYLPTGSLSISSGTDVPLAVMKNVNSLPVTPTLPKYSSHTFTVPTLTSKSNVQLITDPKYSAETSFACSSVSPGSPSPNFMNTISVCKDADKINKDHVLLPVSSEKVSLSALDILSGKSSFVNFDNDLIPLNSLPVDSASFASTCNIFEGLGGNLPSTNVQSCPLTSRKNSIPLHSFHLTDKSIASSCPVVKTTVPSNLNCVTTSHDSQIINPEMPLSPSFLPPTTNFTSTNIQMKSNMPDMDTISKKDILIKNISPAFLNSRLSTCSNLSNPSLDTSVPLMKAGANNLSLKPKSLDLKILPLPPSAQSQPIQGVVRPIKRNNTSKCCTYLPLTQKPPITPKCSDSKSLNLLPNLQNPKTSMVDTMLYNNVAISPLNLPNLNLPSYLYNNMNDVPVPSATIFKADHFYDALWNTTVIPTASSSSTEIQKPISIPQQFSYKNPLSQPTASSSPLSFEYSYPSTFKSPNMNMFRSSVQPSPCENSFLGPQAISLASAPYVPSQTILESPNLLESPKITLPRPLNSDFSYQNLPNSISSLNSYNYTIVPQTAPLELLTLPQCPNLLPTSNTVTFIPHNMEVPKYPDLLTVTALPEKNFLPSNSFPVDSSNLNSLLGSYVSSLDISLPLNDMAPLLQKPFLKIPKLLDRPVVTINNLLPSPNVCVSVPPVVTNPNICSQNYQNTLFQSALDKIPIKSNYFSIEEALASPFPQIELLSNILSPNTAVSETFINTVNPFCSSPLLIPEIALTEVSKSSNCNLLPSLEPVPITSCLTTIEPAVTPTTLSSSVTNNIPKINSSTNSCTSAQISLSATKPVQAIDTLLVDNSLTFIPSNVLINGPITPIDGQIFLPKIPSSMPCISPTASNNIVTSPQMPIYLPNCPTISFSSLSCPLLEVLEAVPGLSPCNNVLVDILLPAKATLDSAFNPSLITVPDSFVPPCGSSGVSSTLSSFLSPVNLPISYQSNDILSKLPVIVLSEPFLYNNPLGCPISSSISMPDTTSSISNIPTYFDSSSSVPFVSLIEPFLSESTFNAFTPMIASTSCIPNMSFNDEVLTSVLNVPWSKPITYNTASNSNLNELANQIPSTLLSSTLSNLTSLYSKRSVSPVQEIPVVSLPVQKKSKRKTPNRKAARKQKKYSLMPACPSEDSPICDEPSKDENISTSADDPLYVPILFDSFDTSNIDDPQHFAASELYSSDLDMPMQILDPCDHLSTQSVKDIEPCVSKRSSSKESFVELKSELSNFTSTASSNTSISSSSEITSNVSSSTLDFKSPEEIVEYIVLKELVNSDLNSNWSLLGKIINILCKDPDEESN